jgi:hypothetical protein
MKRIAKILNLCLGLALLGLMSGCGLFTDQEKPYRGCFWPAEVELNKQAELSAEEQALADLFCDVDRRLESLLADLHSIERQPDQQWMKTLASKHSWLNGVFFAQPSGQVEERYPQTPIKQLDAAALLGAVDQDGRVGLRYRVQETSLGDEFSVVKPIYKGLSRHGYLVVHFDLRSILGFCSNSERMALLSPDRLLWSGKVAGSAGLESLDWPEMLKDRVSDTLEMNGKRFYWLARYVGCDPLIYVVEIPKES